MRTASTRNHTGMMPAVPSSGSGPRIDRVSAGRMARMRKAATASRPRPNRTPSNRCATGTKTSVNRATLTRPISQTTTSIDHSTPTSRTCGLVGKYGLLGRAFGATQVATSGPRLPSSARPVPARITEGERIPRAQQDPGEHRRTGAARDGEQQLAEPHQHRSGGDQPLGAETIQQDTGWHVHRGVHTKLHDGEDRQDRGADPERCRGVDACHAQRVAAEDGDDVGRDADPHTSQARRPPSRYAGTLPLPAWLLTLRGVGCCPGHR